MAVEREEEEGWGGMGRALEGEKKGSAEVC